jgi:hypothetical protein
MNIARRRFLLGILAILFGTRVIAAAAQQQSTNAGRLRGRRGGGSGRWRRRGLRDPFQGTKIGTTGRVIRIGQTNPRIKDPIGGSEDQIQALHDKAFGAGSTSQSSPMSDRLAELLFERWKESTTNAMNKAVSPGF